jgi:hypothetical protein
MKMQISTLAFLLLAIHCTCTTINMLATIKLKQNKLDTIAKVSAEEYAWAVEEIAKADRKMKDEREACIESYKTTHPWSWWIMAIGC